MSRWKWCFNCTSLLFIRPQMLFWYSISHNNVTVLFGEQLYHIHSTCLKVTMATLQCHMITRWCLWCHNKLFVAHVKWTPSELLGNVDVTALFQTLYLCIDFFRKIYKRSFLYSISSIDTFSLSEAKVSSLHDEEESMYEVPQLRRTVSDSGYEKATELSFLSKSTSSDEQVVIVSGRLNMFCRVCHVEIQN